MDPPCHISHKLFLMFPASTTLWDWLQLETYRVVGVVLKVCCHLCLCLSTMVVLVSAASTQLQATLQFRAPLCWVRQSGVGTFRWQVPKWGWAVRVEWSTHHLPGGEEMKGWAVFTESWGCHSFLVSPRVPGRAPGCRSRSADGCKIHFSVGSLSGCVTVKWLEQMGSLEEGLRRLWEVASKGRRLWAVKYFMTCSLKCISHTEQ